MLPGVKLFLPSKPVCDTFINSVKNQSKIRQPNTIYMKIFFWRSFCIAESGLPLLVHAYICKPFHLLRGFKTLCVTQTNILQFTVITSDIYCSDCFSCRFFDIKVSKKLNVLLYQPYFSIHNCLASIKNHRTPFKLTS